MAERHLTVSSSRALLEKHFEELGLILPGEQRLEIPLPVIPDEICRLMTTITDKEFTLQALVAQYQENVNGVKNADTPWMQEIARFARWEVGGGWLSTTNKHIQRIDRLVLGKQTILGDKSTVLRYYPFGGGVRVLGEAPDDIALLYGFFQPFQRALFTIEQSAIGIAALVE